MKKEKGDKGDCNHHQFGIKNFPLEQEKKRVGGSEKENSKLARRGRCSFGQIKDSSFPFP